MLRGPWMLVLVVVAPVGALFEAGSVEAQSLAISIGIRETQGGGGAAGGPIFSDGGTTGGIEQVDIDGQMLAVDGTWQEFSFTPATDTLTAFAGTTADGALDGDWGVLEHIRVQNVDGITQPIRLWIDDVTNTTSAGPTTESFEAFALGLELMFRDPRVSGSTQANLLETPNSSAVTNTAAFSGAQALEMNFQFVDADMMRWARITTFNTPNLPNPAVQFVEPRGGPATISFRARAELIEEGRGSASEVPALGPTALVLLALALAAAATLRLRAA